MQTKRLVLCHQLILLPLIFLSISVFPLGWLFTSGSQSIGASASASVLPVHIQGWFQRAQVPSSRSQVSVFLLQLFLSVSGLRSSSSRGGCKDTLPYCHLRVSWLFPFVCKSHLSGIAFVYGIKYVFFFSSMRTAKCPITIIKKPYFQDLSATLILLQAKLLSFRPPCSYLCQSSH